MTTPLPLLPTPAPVQVAAAGQNPSPDNVLSPEGGGGAFLALLQAVPTGGGGAQAPMDALRQLLSALTGAQGKGLPDGFTPAQLAALVDKAGPKLKAALLQALRDQSQGRAAQGAEADVLAMLQQLLRTPADGTGSAAAETPLPQSAAQAAGAPPMSDPRGAAGGRESGNAAAAPPVLSQEGLVRHDAVGPHAAAGEGISAPSTAAPAAAAPLQALRQLLEAALPSALPGATGAEAGPAASGDGAASALTELFAKLFPHAAGKERIDARGLVSAVDKTLSLPATASDNGASTGVAGGTAANGSPAYATALGAPPAPFAAPAGNPSLPVAVPFNQQGWDQALGHNLVWMAKNDVQTASMRLNPPHLGPLEVRIAFNNDQATVTFVSHHSAVREAVESALPRLRDMFSDAGVDLGNVDVSDQTPSGRHGAQSGGDGPGHGTPVSAETTGPAGLTGATEGTLPSLGLVDFFA